MIAYGYWFYNELLPMVGWTKPSIGLETPNNGIFRVKMSSTRLECFRHSNVCVTCGRVGELWILESHTGESPHLNLYTIVPSPLSKNKQKKYGTNERLILMTEDHIMPLSKGGPDIQQNLQTMCVECNALKGAKIPEGLIPHDYVSPPMFPHLILSR